MSRRERYIARKSGQSNENPSFNVGDYDIDQLYNQFTPNYGDVEDFSLFPFTPNPSQVPFRMDDPENTSVDIDREPLNKQFYPDQFEGYIPKKDFPDVLRQDTDPESLLYHLGDLRRLGALDFQGGIMDAFPEEGMTPGRDFEGAPNIPHISEYMDYFNTLSPREVQGLGSIFQKMYRDKAIDKKLYDFYNA
tara:strand:+ start:61 stop:636 length:576 start_codon:yes stop_codon:yes gene_type:complete